MGKGEILTYMTLDSRVKNVSATNLELNGIIYNNDKIKKGTYLHTLRKLYLVKCFHKEVYSMSIQIDQCITDSKLYLLKLNPHDFRVQ